MDYILPMKDMVQLFLRMIPVQQQSELPCNSLIVNSHQIPKYFYLCRPNDMQSCLIFHYNLKFYDSDEDSFDAVSLKRFVMQSVIGNIVAFRVHAPCSGAFLLDIFANAVTPQEYLTGEPMKFKSVCKFKVSKIACFDVLIVSCSSPLHIFLQICCEELQTVMVPLPDCASGEWGPTKATRLFGLIPITHQVCVVISLHEFFTTTFFFNIGTFNFCESRA